MAALPWGTVCFDDVDDPATAHSLLRAQSTLPKAIRWTPGTGYQSRSGSRT